MLSWFKTQYLSEFVDGVLMTVEVSLLSFLLALVIGFALVAMRISRLMPLRAVGFTYVEIIRNIPALGLIFIVVFVLPEVGVTIPLFWCGVLALGIYEGAYVGETLRTGVNTIDLGTVEVARALGCRRRQIFTRVIVPQAVRNVVQPLGNVMIKTLIGSSLVATIGLADITGVARRVNLREAEPILFILAGLIYVVLALTVGRLIRYLERKMRYVR